jgi:O-antigen/teichoic acid export membrane protein
LRSKAKVFFEKGHNRTLKIKKNIVLSFLVKVGSSLIGFILIPVTLHYINPLQYGVWLTVSSIVLWMSNFDIGLSNGLRNKLAHSLALGEQDNILKYVSTTYAALFAISAFIFCCFFVAGSYVNWNSVLNVPQSVLNNLWTILVVVLSCFCLQFVLQTVSTVLTASHQVYKTSVITFMGQMLSLAVIYALSIYTKGNLLTLVLVLAGVPVVVLLIANIYLFSTSLKDFAPKLRYIDIKNAKSLLHVGGKFFFLQIGALIIYETDNIIITGIKSLGPEAVTKFNIAYKLFTTLVMAAVVIITPYWSAFTDAYAKNEFDWIKQALKRMRQIWMLLSGVSVLLFIFSNFIYDIWLGKDRVAIDRWLTLSMAVYVISYIFQLIYTYFQNGTGKVRLQLISLLVCSCINIPLSLYWGRLYGLAGVVNANTAVTVVMNVLFYTQSKKILNRTAVGIWDK